MKREAAVTKEMNAKMADDKKLSRKEKDERILWKKNEVTFQYSMHKFHRKKIKCSQSHNRIHIFHRLPNMNRLHLPSSTTTPCFYPFLFLCPFTSFQLRWAHQLTMLQVWESLLVLLPCYLLELDLLKL